MSEKIFNPATYTPKIVTEFAAIINARFKDYVALESEPLMLLDPFAGTGQIEELFDLCSLPLNINGLEMEPEWAEMSKHGITVVGDATEMPFPDAMFDIIATSPTYGNRMADHHEPMDDSQRRTYRVGLGRALNENNSGRMQWGKPYRELHEKVWQECRRVLKPGGILILNLRDHVRASKRIPVTAWHWECLQSLGFRMQSVAAVSTPAYGFGANAESRVGSGETVAEFTRGR